ncbi:MAG: hypothetical protein R2828_24810 [Saprospiraceae bacterium]
MAVVILSHTVADYNTWKPIYDADAARRADAGFKELICGQDAPNSVYIVYETDTPEIIQQMFADPNLVELMKEAGVTSPPKVVIVK